MYRASHDKSTYIMMEWMNALTVYSITYRDPTDHDALSPFDSVRPPATSLLPIPCLLAKIEGDVLVLDHMSEQDVSCCSR